MERRIGEAQFEQIKQALKGKILPAIHPENIRVRLIAKDIIEALQRGLRREEGWSELGYALEVPVRVHEGSGRETILALVDSKEENLEGMWRKEDEILDASWVHQSRKKGEKRRSQPTTEHLEGLNWEVLVVNELVVNAFCLPGGKIVVFTGLLEHFRADAEIATIIGHEVGHAVARHAAETITKNLWLAILQLILYQFIMPDLAHAMSALLLRFLSPAETIIRWLMIMCTTGNRCFHGYKKFGLLLFTKKIIACLCTLARMGLYPLDENLRKRGMVQDGGTQLERRRQYLLKGLAASLQLVDPFSKSGHTVKLAPKDDLPFLRFVSLPKGRKLLSRYLQLIPPAADLARIVYMAIFRHLRSLFGKLSFDSGAFEATTNLANTISSCVNGMDLRGLSFCLVAVVCSSEQPPPLRRLGSRTGDGAAMILISVLEKATELITDSHAAGKFSMPTCALWQASFDAFFDLLTKYCGNKYDTIVKSFTETQPSKEKVARAICQEMPVELLRASHRHTNEGQRKLLSDFAQRSMLVTRFNAHRGRSGQKIISESVRPIWTKS
ncbi:hypothetical protein L1049_015159 [Liquidambar formosana]|uniref:Peptidase M48 domain-containing protein n=1 Tax=Liquidambar formosana TaxID=63359 RepID=A0AAP0RX47_LIQFO